MRLMDYRSRQKGNPDSEGPCPHGTRVISPDSPPNDLLKMYENVMLQAFPRHEAKAVSRLNDAQ